MNNRYVGMAAQLWLACFRFNAPISSLTYGEGCAVLAFHSGHCQRMSDLQEVGPQGTVQFFSAEGFRPPGAIPVD